MPAPLKNQNNRKPPGEARTAKIELRVRPRDKARLVKAAQHSGGLSRYILDAAAAKAGITIEH